MSKKADGTPFKTPNKRPHGAANSSVTPSKMRKVLHKPHSVCIKLGLV